MLPRYPGLSSSGLASGGRLGSEKPPDHPCEVSHQSTPNAPVRESCQRQGAANRTPTQNVAQTQVRILPLAPRTKVSTMKTNLSLAV